MMHSYWAHNIRAVMRYMGLNYSEMFHCHAQRPSKMSYNVILCSSVSKSSLMCHFCKNGTLENLESLGIIRLFFQKVFGAFGMIEHLEKTGRYWRKHISVIFFF